MLPCNVYGTVHQIHHRGYSYCMTLAIVGAGDTVGPVTVSYPRLRAPVMIGRGLSEERWTKVIAYPCASSTTSPSETINSGGKPAPANSDRVLFLAMRKFCALACYPEVFNLCKARYCRVHWPLLCPRRECPPPPLPARPRPILRPPPFFGHTCLTLSRQFCCGRPSPTAKFYLSNGSCEL